MKTFFYIIERDKTVHEIENKNNWYEESMKSWANGGLVAFPTFGFCINSVDISKILNQEKYQEFLDQTNPKVFIKNGCWYHAEDKFKPFKYEKWRQDEIDEGRKQLPESITVPEEIRNKAVKRLKAIGKIRGYHE